MDTIEATEMVMSRIKNIDPQNASKIMGYLLIQDQSQNELIRLAFGPENLLVSVIQQAKSFLDISSNTSYAPSSPSPPLARPRIVIPNNGYNYTNHTPLPPHSPWSSSGFMINGGGSSASCNNNAVDWSADGGKNDVFSGGGGVNDDADGWRPCMHFDLGFCKNGDNRGFEDAMCLGSSSPTAINGFQDFMRVKAIRQHQQQRFGGFAEMGLGNSISSSSSSSSSRQIYLTFPADSTFTGEDVSNYFSVFGAVEDVRIPYQEKRMFGFVEFVYPETVKSVLAKGNPHFICDSRVLVKPYKEKGTIPIKKHHQHQIEPFDHIPFGARMFNHDMMLRRNVDGEDEYQRTIDFQERKLMNMRLTTEHYNSSNVYGEGSDLKVAQQVNDDDREINGCNGSYIHER